MSMRQDSFIYALNNGNGGFAGSPRGYAPLSCFNADSTSVYSLAVTLTGGPGVALANDLLGASTIDPNSGGGPGNERTAIDTNALQYVLDPATGFLVAVPAASGAADDNAAVGVLVPTLARGTLFDGVAWDRARSATSANLLSIAPVGAALVAPVANWSINHIPAAATQATISRAAGAAGIKHVCTSIHAKLRTATAATASAVQVNLRDGATGAGTILWATTLNINTNVATVGGVLNDEITLTGLNIVGTAATAMTLEFAGAGAANTFEDVAMTGYTASS